jgi:hypothetical protein
VREEEIQSLANTSYQAGLVEQRESVRAQGSFKERCSLHNVDLLHAALAYLGGVVGEHGDEVVAAGAGQQGAEGVWKIKNWREERPCGRRGSFRSFDETGGWDRLMEPASAPPRTYNLDEDAAEAKFITIHMLRPAQRGKRGLPD